MARMEMDYNIRVKLENARLKFGSDSFDTAKNILAKCGKTLNSPSII